MKYKAEHLYADGHSPFALAALAPPTFWNPAAPAARNAIRNTMVFFKGFKGPKATPL